MQGLPPEAVGVLLHLNCTSDLEDILQHSHSIIRTGLSLAWLWQVDSGSVESTKIKVLGPMPMAAASRVFVKADLSVASDLEEGLKAAGVDCEHGRFYSIQDMISGSRFSTP